MRFHHASFRIRKGSLDAVERLFRHLGFETVERSVTERDAAIWMGPKGSDAVVQFNEADAPAQVVEQRTSSHVAFLDSEPKMAANGLDRWCVESGITTRVGQWSEKRALDRLP